MAKSKRDQTRRDLLKAIAVLPINFPVSGLAQILVNGFIERAKAAETRTVVRNYVYFMAAEAPPRWVFDLLLTPYSQTGFVPNPHLGTVGVASGDRYTSVKYATVTRRVGGVSLNVPPLWAVNVPKVAGGVRPLDALLTNMIHIRGVDTAAPAHPSARMRAFRPLGAAHTVTGLVADTVVGYPLKGINVGIAEYEFAGKSDYTPTTFQIDRSRNLGKDVLNPFLSGATATFAQRKKEFAAEIDAAQSALDAYAQSQHPGSESVRKSQADVANMVKVAVADLAPKWEALFDKYKALVDRALLEIHVPGVHDKPMGAATHPEKSVVYKYRDAAFVNTPANLHEMIEPGKTGIMNMVEGFALAELAITEKLSNSVTINIGKFTDLKINGDYVNGTLDEHNVGSLVSLALNTKWHGAFGTCLLEFIDRLKALDIFNETVVQTGSEFNRSPRRDLAGSEHGYQANSLMIFSGMVKSPIIIGNVKNESGLATTPGSWGAAAETINGKVLTPAHVANTLAALLNLPEIVRMDEAEALLNIDFVTKTVTSRAGKAKQT